MKHISLFAVQELLVKTKQGSYFLAQAVPCSRRCCRSNLSMLHGRVQERCRQLQSRGGVNPSQRCSSNLKVVRVRCLSRSASKPRKCGGDLPCGVYLFLWCPFKFIHQRSRITVFRIVGSSWVKLKSGNSSSENHLS